VSGFDLYVRLVGEAVQVRLRRLHPRAVYKAALRQVLVPLPRDPSTNQPLRDTALLQWCTDVVTSLTPAPARA
jgi:transcription-repair coupling factor (superfamily II helicase)